MGFIKKVGAWFSDRSDRFIRGDVDRGNGYYTTREAREAYRGMENEPDAGIGDEEQLSSKPDMDPFGHGEGDYGGRVPYRSRQDLEAEALREQPRAAQPMPQQVMGPQGPQQPAMNQQAPMPRQPIMNQQPVMNQNAAMGRQTYTASNVVPFPGMQQGPDGMVYAHVEYIVLLRNRNECKNVIAYIKTSASVFLNMEFIASDSERQRCVDMLSGAAYTLGCALNKISPRGIYLISAPTVKVVMDPAIQKFSATQEAQGYAQPQYEQQPYGGYTARQQAVNPYEQQPMGQRGGYAAQRPASDPYERNEQPQSPRSAFAQESPTARFQAQGTQRNQPVSFASAVTGGYQDTGRMRPAEYVQ